MVDTIESPSSTLPSSLASSSNWLDEFSSLSSLDTEISEGGSKKKPQQRVTIVLPTVEKSLPLAENPFDFIKEKLREEEEGNGLRDPPSYREHLSRKERSSSKGVEESGLNAQRAHEVKKDYEDDVGRRRRREGSPKSITGGRKKPPPPDPKTSQIIAADEKGENGTRKNSSSSEQQEIEGEERGEGIFNGTDLSLLILARETVVVSDGALSEAQEREEEREAPINFRREKEVDSHPLLSTRDRKCCVTQEGEISGGHFCALGRQEIVDRCCATDVAIDRLIDRDREHLETGITSWDQSDFSSSCETVVPSERVLLDKDQSSNYSTYANKASKKGWGAIARWRNKFAGMSLWEQKVGCF